MSHHHVFIQKLKHDMENDALKIICTCLNGATVIKCQEFDWNSRILCTFFSRSSKQVVIPARSASQRIRIVSPSYMNYLGHFTASIFRIMTPRLHKIKQCPTVSIFWCNCISRAFLVEFRQLCAGNPCLVQPRAAEFLLATVRCTVDQTAGQGQSC